MPICKLARARTRMELMVHAANHCAAFVAPRESGVALLASRVWRVAEAIAEIGYANPFLAERIELEKKALGKAFACYQPFLQYRPDCSVSDMFPNATALPEEANPLTDEVVNWVNKRLGDDCPLPGSIRELEQCVRSIMIRGVPVPAGRQPPTKREPVAKSLSNVEDGDVSREELLTDYFSLVYSKSGSYRAAGRRLGVDWRTVKYLVRHVL